MIAFLKSLRFWRYRALYLSLVQEHAAAGYDVQRHYQRTEALYRELHRLRTILAPYGARIMAGQARDTAGPILLPPLEFEMARASLHVSARMSSNLELDLLTGGFNAYVWFGRDVRVRA